MKLFENLRASLDSILHRNFGRRRESRSAASRYRISFEEGSQWGRVRTFRHFAAWRPSSSAAMERLVPLVWPEAAAGWGAAHVRLHHAAAPARRDGRPHARRRRYALRRRVGRRAARVPRRGRGRRRVRDLQGARVAARAPDDAAGRGRQLIASRRRSSSRCCCASSPRAMDDAAARARGRGGRGRDRACACSRRSRSSTRRTSPRWPAPRAAVIAEARGATLAGRGERDDARGGAATNLTNLVANDAQKLGSRSTRTLWAAPPRSS